MFPRHFYLLPAVWLLSLCLTQGQSVPKLNTNPDSFLRTTKFADSVLEYSYPSKNDSVFMRKWTYFEDYEVNTLETVMCSWNTVLKAWTQPKSRYVYGFDKSGRLLDQTHYTYRDSHGNWRGCNSDGCGKKEWQYDAMGNPVLRTQSYWLTGATNWTLTEVEESQYDMAGNKVMGSVKTRSVADLTTWTGSKDEYSFDSGGHLTGHIPYTWHFEWIESTSDGTVIYHEWDDWYPRNKEERSYNGDGNLSGYLLYHWNPVVTGWYLGSYWMSDFGWDRVDITYGQDGKKTAMSLYKWDIFNDKWLPGISEEDIRNEKGQLISELAFDVVDLYWIYPIRKEYAYDDAGRRVVEIATSWNDMYIPWTEKVKKEFRYDPDGMVEEEILSNWDIEKNSWAPSLKTMNGFDQQGRQVLKAGYIWNGEAGGWVGSTEQAKQEWAFDKSGREVLHILYVWDNDIRDWVGKTKTESKHDESGNMIFLAGFQWDPGKGEWKGDLTNGKREWEYDPAGRLTAETEFIWNTEEFGWQEKIRVTADYDPEGDPLAWRQTWWNPESREREMVIGYYFFYNPVATGNQELIAETVRVFPNPTEGRITVTGLVQPSAIGLYSLQGRLLRTFTHVEGAIDISDLPAGVYVLQLSSGGETVLRQKVIKW